MGATQITIKCERLGVIDAAGVSGFVAMLLAGKQAVVEDASRAGKMVGRETSIFKERS